LTLDITGHSHRPDLFDLRLKDTEPYLNGNRALKPALADESNRLLSGPLRMTEDPPSGETPPK